MLEKNLAAAAAWFSTVVFSLLGRQGMGAPPIYLPVFEWSVRVEQVKETVEIDAGLDSPIGSGAEKKPVKFLVITGSILDAQRVPQYTDGEVSEKTLADFQKRYAPGRKAEFKILVPTQEVKVGQYAHFTNKSVSVYPWHPSHTMTYLGDELQKLSPHPSLNGMSAQLKSNTPPIALSVARSDSRNVSISEFLFDGAIAVGASRKLDDGLEISVLQTTHKRSHVDGPQRAHAIVELKKEGETEQLSLGFTIDRGQIQKQWDTKRWKGYEISITDLVYDKEIRLKIRRVE